MRVKELIALLEKCDPEATVSVWSAYDDAEEFDVRVSITADQEVHVGSVVFGEPVTAPPRLSLRDALEEQWLIAHDEHCTNMRNCTSFGGAKECRHPRPQGTQ